MSKQFLKFCIIGGIGTFLNLVVFWLLVEFAGIFYIVGAMIAFVIALTNNFILNKFWTFRGNHRYGIIAQYASYWVVNLAGLAVNIFILLVLVEVVKLWYLAAQFIGILVATGVNYMGSKKWSFVK